MSKEKIDVDSTKAEEAEGDTSDAIEPTSEIQTEEVGEESIEDLDITNEEDSGAEQGAEVVEDGREWFILQCYSLQEYKVLLRLEAVIEKEELGSKVFRILVPEEETVEIRNNKRVERTTKIYPGYVFIEAIMDDNLWFLIRKVPGVAKFVGTKNRPTPVREEEILRVLRKIGDKSKKIEVDFETGETIKVISGPFRGYSGSISEIQGEKGKLKTLISIFGRETPVELDFTQVEKIIR